ncbi:hypothetical protein HOLleu_22476 [Holothuria leucospilota]|uniref:CCHC-type domain-containing protein n=1 Tax=Holothuria leucospilota TaxID=206669 RepID=A0A9Q1BYM5_HOLLE|nr:hypothetical protein HOLleu_22476 [Holothuria leucospilota]
MQSPYIKCEIKWTIRINPELTFDKAMMEAATLEEEKTEYDSMGEDATIHLQRLDKNRPQKDTAELTKLRDTIHDLHQKIITLESKLQQTPQGQPTITSQSRRPQFRFADDGTPICWKCNGIGHIGRDCRGYFQQEHHPYEEMNHARQQPRRPHWRGNDEGHLN